MVYQDIEPKADSSALGPRSRKNRDKVLHVELNTELTTVDSCQITDRTKQTEENA